VQGNNRREEYIGDGDSPQIVSISLDRKATYQLDLKSRQYVEYRITESHGRPIPTYESGKTVDLYFETTDTGETREFFGRVAKHLVMRERRVAEPGACGMGSQTVDTDGWYIPTGDTGTRRGYLVMGMISRDGRMCHDKLVFHEHPASPGLAVVETRDGVKKEILELSSAPLDKSLFEVPSGFEKVDSLPGQQGMTWLQRLEWYLQQLERAFESWLR
jgi:hypothetical protein